MITEYRKRPVRIQAVQWTGDNLHEVLEFAGTSAFVRVEDDLKINTLEGVMNVSVGDYVIRGIAGEYYPCKPDIFEKTYEAV